MATKTHWKKLNNPDYLGAYALDPGEDMILTIKSAGKETFVGTAGKKEEGLLVHFKENVKPMICNATNAKTITKVAGSPYIEDWPGTRISVYSQEVSAFGDTVDALRIRPYAPKEELYCDDCGSEIKAANGKSPRQIAASTKAKYEKQLCGDCAVKRFEGSKSEESSAGKEEVENG
ncbi:MAG: hypothetical protein PHE79_04905 [Eubacteriales bacterium]|nr:hypothetical protein [Eubacteriales bacterium]